MALPCYKSQVVAAFPGTLSEITKKSGVTKQTCIRWIRILREAGEAHVKRWRRSKGQGPLMRVYVIGPGKDAKRPGRLSNAIYRARYREKYPETVEIYNARRRAINAANKAARTPHNWMSALTSVRLETGAA